MLPPGYSSTQRQGGILQIRCSQRKFLYFLAAPLVAGTQSVHADIVVGAPFIIAGAGVPAR